MQAAAIILVTKASLPVERPRECWTQRRYFPIMMMSKPTFLPAVIRSGAPSTVLKAPGSKEKLQSLSRRLPKTYEARSQHLAACTESALHNQKEMRGK